MGDGDDARSANPLATTATVQVLSESACLLLTDGGQCPLHGTERRR